MFHETQSLSVGKDSNGAAIVADLSRTGSSLNRGEYRDSTGEVTLSIAHTRGKRTRSMCRVDLSKVVADPLSPSNSMPSKAGCWVVVDYPVTGLTRDDIGNLVAGFAAWLQSGSNIGKLINTEV